MEERQYREIIKKRQQAEGLEATYRDRYNLAAVLVKSRKFDEAGIMLRDVLRFLEGRDGRESEPFRQQEATTKRLLVQVLGARNSSGEEALAVTDSA